MNYKFLFFIQPAPTFSVRCTRSWRHCWTHVSWLPTCINETRWRLKSCSQFNLWEIVQSKPLRRCWASSWNNLTVSTCVSSTSWNTSSNSTSIRDSLKTDTRVNASESVYWLKSNIYCYVVFCLPHLSQQSYFTENICRRVPEWMTDFHGYEFRNCESWKSTVL